MEETKNNVQTNDTKAKIVAEEKTNVKNVVETSRKKVKLRTIIVIAILVIFALGVVITYRAEYLETLEIGENYIEVFNKNLSYKVIIATVNFVVIFIAVMITNFLIKKGLRKFFEEEKKDVPKLLNKSLALLFSLIAAIVSPNMFLEKIILFLNNAQFGITDPIFNADVGFYMFQAPLISFVLYYLIAIFVSLSVYTALYYIIAFNRYFDGVDRQTLKNSALIKQILLNVMVIGILIAGLILLNTQNMVLDNFISINNQAKTAIAGAGLIESTIKLWGYRILSIVIVVSIYMAIRYFKKGSAKNVIKSIAAVPIYLLRIVHCNGWI